MKIMTPRGLQEVLPQHISLSQGLIRKGIFAALLGVAGLITYIGYSIYTILPDVPEIHSIHDYQPKLGSRLYSADRQLIAEFASERRVMVPFERIPPLLLKAFISAEDKRFYEHTGLDWMGVIQAVLDKFIHPLHKLRGASTITQQVAKSLLMIEENYESATERSLGRKLKEAVLAKRLEEALSKDEILYIYVHQIFLGNKAYGVGAAAEHYFRKNVWDLTLAEMATLAGLPQRPSDYSPITRPDAAHARRKYVLRRMLEDGYISDQEHDAAVQEQLRVFEREELYLDIAPHYAEAVRQEIVDKFGEQALLDDGLEIETGLQVELQGYADQAVEKGLRELDKRQGFRGPLFKLDASSQYNTFIQAYRKKLHLADNEKVLWRESDIHLGLVTQVDDIEKIALVNVAGTQAILTLDSMKWARVPDPTQRVDLHPLLRISEALQAGDVIQVKILEPNPAVDGPVVALEQNPIAQSALLSVEPSSGYVVAMVGGYDFESSAFNRALQACREPGSAFKPIVYSAAIDKLDYTPSTLLDDKPVVFDDEESLTRWKPNNAGHEFRGQLPLRTCLKDSINMPALRVAEAVGIDDVIVNAKRLGIVSPMKRELGTALGSSCTTLKELVDVYTTLHEYGQRKPIKFVKRVIDRYGNVLFDDTSSLDPAVDLLTQITAAYRHITTPISQALDEQTSFITINLLKNVVTSGTATMAARLGQPLGGKTGTTNDSYDAWFLGFSRRLVSGVWVGHDKKERPLGVGEQGGKTALPIWVAYMEPALLNHTVDPAVRKQEPDFDPPPGVVHVGIDPETGLIARPEASRIVYEWYRAGTEPKNTAPDKSVFDAGSLNPFEVDAPL